MKQITAKHYAKIQPFLPVQRGNVRIPNIIVINAVVYVMENGCKWRALLRRFGSSKRLARSASIWSGSARGRGGTASRSPSTSHCAPPERRFPENRPTGRRPAAEPAPKPRKTDADAQLSALGAETAPVPLKNKLRKTPGKPVIRKIRTFSVGH